MNYGDVPTELTNEMVLMFDKLLQKSEERLEPSLIGLSPAERENCGGTGLNCISNGRKMLSVAREFEYAFGIEVDVDEFAYDMNQHDKALWMLERLQPLVQKLEDTVIASRFQVFLHTFEVFANARASADPSLSRAMDRLEEELFPKRNRTGNP